MFARARRWSNGHRARRAVKIPHLTERERETLALVAQQLSTDTIAERMVISPNTVKTHIGHIISKLRVQNRDQAVLYAVLKGYLTPSDSSD